MKDWQARITETINFVRNAPILIHLDKRAAVAQLLVEYNFAHPFTQVESEAMSQGTLLRITGRATAKEFRKFRRALIMIRVALRGEAENFVVTFVGQMADANLNAALSTVINDVYQAKQLELTHELNTLLATPAAFLGAHKIQVTTAPASGPMQFGFYRDVANNRYGMQPYANVAALYVKIAVQVYHIHVQRWPAVQATLGAIAGCAIGGAADLAVTTQLTGCSVIYDVANDRSRMVAAHVQPNGTTGPLLCQAMRGGAALANGIGDGGANGVFGAVNAPEQNGYVMGAGACYFIGVRVGGTWELHGQQYPVGALAAVPNTWQIVP